MVKLGGQVQTWKNGIAKDITFVLTEDCNLRCKYCYICNKNSYKKMDLETAKKAVDYLLDHPELFPEESVIFNFIGGEPFIEAELANEITHYIKVEMFKKNHKWFKSHMFNFSTNGINYNSKPVQDYVKNHRERLSIGISVDGNETKHDMQRVYKDGSGTYKDVIKNVPLWLKQFPGAGTKATFSSDDLPYLKDSIISLWEMGITNVNANVVFEDVWKDGDDNIFESQLKSLADYAIDNDLYTKYNCTFFSEYIGNPLKKEDLEKNWCGAGKMLAIDCDGNFYPCVRFIPYSLSKREGIKIGDIENGINTDLLRPFLSLTIPSQSDPKCVNCNVATGCAWCQGWNYDDADTPTIYQRSTAICKMHKARVRANNYYWTKLGNKKRIDTSSFGTINWKKHLYFIIADDSFEHCNYTSKNLKVYGMDNDVFEKALNFAEENFYKPIILKSKSGYGEEMIKRLENYRCLYIDQPKPKNDKNLKNTIDVYYNNTDNAIEAYNSILHIDSQHLSNISDLVKNLFQKVKRINLILSSPNTFTKEDFDIYESQLSKLADFLYEKINLGFNLELNVISDRLTLKEMKNCNAGYSSFAVGPNGKFYICPAYYFDNPDSYIGDLENGINLLNQRLYSIKNAPICSKCDAYHCRRCIYFNEKYTREVNTPSLNQCKLSHLERKYSYKLNEKLSKINKKQINNLMPLKYDDPLELIGK